MTVFAVLILAALLIGESTCFTTPKHLQGNDLGRNRYSTKSTILFAGDAASEGTKKNSDDEESLPTYASYLATCIPGLSHVLADELSEIHPDIVDISASGPAAVKFDATREASLYALCWVRTAHRLLELIAATEEDDVLYNRDDLQNFIKSDALHVPTLLGNGEGGLLTLSVKTILNSPRQLPKDLSHSHFTSLSVKNALCDVVQDLRGDRPNVDTDCPDLPLVAILRGRDTRDGGAASLSLYRSLHPPGSLHRRGYRQGGAMHKAAMKESMASGLLREAKWHEQVKTARDNATESHPLRFVDPMCGSGSFLLEGAMIAADIAPGLMRIRCGVLDHKMPPVTRWKSTDGSDAKSIWKRVLSESNDRAKAGLKWIRSSNNNDEDRLVRFYANDIHEGSLVLLESSLEQAGLSDLVQISNRDCYDLSVPNRDVDVPYFIVTNPPWGMRLTDDIVESWEGLRHFLRDVCPEKSEAWVLSGHKKTTTILKLRRDRMIPIQTGDNTLRWIQYTIRGTKAPESSEQAAPQEDSVVV